LHCTTCIPADVALATIELRCVVSSSGRHTRSRPTRLFTAHQMPAFIPTLSDRTHPSLHDAAHALATSRNHSHRTSINYAPQPVLPAPRSPPDTQIEVYTHPHPRPTFPSQPSLRLPSCSPFASRRRTYNHPPPRERVSLHRITAPELVTLITSRSTYPPLLQPKTSPLAHRHWYTPTHPHPTHPRTDAGRSGACASRTRRTTKRTPTESVVVGK
jgi:hypothetical protein